MPGTALLAGTATLAGKAVFAASEGEPRCRNFDHKNSLRRDSVGINQNGVGMPPALGACMNNIQSFRDLDAWRLGMDLVDAVIALSRHVPRVEFDLRRQINRAVISIPSNVAEGWKRKRRRGAYQNHVSIAMGSHAELETHLEICIRNGYLERAQCKVAWALLVRVGPILERLHDSLD